MRTAIFLTSLICASSAVASDAINAFKRVDKVLEARAEARQEASAHYHAPHQKRQNTTSPYLNSATEKFVVDGTKIPDVDFDVGESYAGLVPISSAANETRELFFWFFPSSNPAATDELVIWFNGGPGCSSLSGLILENGPFLWQPGTFAPVQNPYTWVNLTNMIWVEQPVGVGYTQGTPNITNEVELAQEFMGFWKNWVEDFQVQGRKVYITGESYGGYYVPYVADAFINADDTTYYNLAGIAINDPILGDGDLQQEVPVIPYVDYWADLFNLNETFSAAVHAKADSCGYTDYFNTYLTFPPPAGPFPSPTNSSNDCDVFDDVFSAVLEINPCFNIYHITDTCPHLFNVLGIVNQGDYFPPGAQVYFNRTDVQAAINAPIGTNWMQCTNKNVFTDATPETTGEMSVAPAQDGVLKHVIESTNNTIIGVGDLDYLLPTNGTLMALQNLTWNGVQGFQVPPTNNFYVPYHPEYNLGALAGAGDLGVWVSERGLTFYTVYLSGHELPEYAPGAAYRIVELLLGRISDLSQTGDFTTQTGNFTGTTPLVKRDSDLGRMKRDPGNYGRMVM
ncbi:hypothetical protein MMC28_010048 [Mycoblastus sanguinarius]|nr:hypothetical protein [Mycoblastus sanguinarius]